MTRFDDVTQVVTIEADDELKVQSEIYRIEGLFFSRDQSIDFTRPTKIDNKYVAKGMVGHVLLRGWWDHEPETVSS